MLMRMEAQAFLPILIVALGGGCARVHLPEARIMPGQGHEGLTWERAVDLALAHHPDLIEARERLAAQAHHRNEALGAYLPSAEGKTPS